MKTITEYIIENSNNTSKPCVYSLYKVNVKHQHRANGWDGIIENNIGDITEIRFKYISGSGNDADFVYGEPREKDGNYNNWVWAKEFPVSKFINKETAEKYLQEVNTNPKLINYKTMDPAVTIFYKYFINKSEAEQEAKRAINEYKSQHYTLDSLCKALQNFKPFKDKKYTFDVTRSKTQVEHNYTDCILVNTNRYGQSTIRLTLSDKDPYIHVKITMGGEFKCANIECLYEVIERANSRHDSDDISTHQLYYSIY